MLQNYLWFFYALASAVLWGIQYATIEQLLKVIPAHIVTLVYLTASALVYACIVTWFQPEWELTQFKGYFTLKNISLIAVIVLAGCISTFFTFSAIALETATKASLVEISYPFFVALFAVFLYREHSLNGQTLMGGLVIFFGITMVLRS
jgi:drug/metabolite transporter (DMT)-like permease